MADTIRSIGRRGWVTLGTAMLAMFLLGAIYAYGVLLPYIALDFGWARSQASLPHAVLLFIYAVGMALGGAIQDRTSPRWIAVAGGALFGVGVIAATYSRGLFTLVLLYGVLGGIGFGFAYVAAVTAAMKSLPARRGLAAGSVVGAFGLGALVWAPLAQHFLRAPADWRLVMVAYGIAALVLLPLLGLGIRAPRQIPGASQAREPGLSLATALRSRLFWLVFVAYMLVTTVGLMLLAYYVAYGRLRGLPPAQAALLISAFSVGSGVGRIGVGWLSDRTGRFPALIAASLLAAAVLGGLVLGLPPATLFVAALLSGLAFGAWLSLYGPTSTDLFGLRSAGAIYGVLYISYGLGGLLGPPVGGWLSDRVGFTALFLAGAILCVLGAGIFVLAARTPAPVHEHHPALEEEFPT